MQEKKLAAVAPIIRRKKSDGPAVAEAPAMAFTPPSEPATVTPLPAPLPPPPAAPAGISVESVARFFGINKG